MKKIVISLMLVGLLLVGCGKKNKDLDLDRITASIEETNLFKDASKIDIDYIDQCNQIDARILNAKNALIYTNHYPACKQITFNCNEITFNPGEPYFVQVKLTNVNGQSEWSGSSNGIIKCNKPSLSITNVYGSNVIEYQKGVYYINSRVNIDGLFNVGLTNVTPLMYNMCSVLIQNNINGVWNDIEYTSTPVLNNGTVTLEMDADNEIENGGIDIGEYSLVRLKAFFGDKIYYSDPITLFKCPLSEITLTNVVPKIKRIPISNLKINGSFTRNKYTSNCKVSCYRQLADNLELVSYIMVDTDKFTLDIASLLNKKYSYGDILILSYSGCNINGVYSDEIFDIVTYQISEILDTPILTFSDNYEQTTYGSYNLYYKDKVQLRWNEITPKLFPHDKITYNIYRNNELLKTTSETTYVDCPDLQTVVYCVSVTNGYDEFKSIPKLKNKITNENRPQFSNSQSISFRPVSSLLSQSNVSLLSQNILPTKVIISFSPAQSVTTPSEYLRYILHCGYYQEDLEGPQGYISCCELNNVTYDPIRQMNDAIIDFGDFGFGPSDNIVVCLTCIDRYGLESADRTPLQ